MKFTFGFSMNDFNPRSPRGEQRETAGPALIAASFQSTLPSRGATGPLTAQPSAIEHFNPRSPRGEQRAP